jgi:hypothetical protein
MNTDELINQARNIAQRLTTGVSQEKRTAFTVACEFLRQYAGEKSSFYKRIAPLPTHPVHTDSTATEASFILIAFMNYLEAGLKDSVSPERKAQIDVVSELLSQANALLADKSIHPAAPAVLIGATLEEFLRTWIDAKGLSLGKRKPGMESYVEVLRENDLITKQDSKDITSWAGIRNSAAHGDWESVQNREKIALMLQGVNLFMRQRSGE